MSSLRTLTPGGNRPLSQFRRMPPGGIVRRSTSGYSVIAPAGGSPALSPAAASRPVEAWKAFVGWENDTGTPVSTMSATWVVPQPPTLIRLQTIFLFPGLENRRGDPGILQPVLQWGESALGGGAYWSVASWFVAGGPAYASVALVPVAPGDVLTGRMARRTNAAGQPSYSCWFDDIPGTEMTVEGIPELTWCAVALEAYDISLAAEYPPNDSTDFTSIALSAGDMTSIPWLPENSAARIGEGVRVGDASASAGRITIVY